MDYDPRNPVAYLAGFIGANKLRLDAPNCLMLSWLIETAAADVERDGRLGVAEYMRDIASAWRDIAAERTPRDGSV